MKITDFLEPAPTAPVKFEIDGIDGPLYCKVMTCEEASSLSGSLEEATKPGHSFRFAARILALCLVDVDGNAVTSEEAWLKAKASVRNGLSKLIDKVREINGLQNAEEVKELGNASTATPVSDSNSSSVSASEKPEESCEE